MATKPKSTSTNTGEVSTGGTGSSAGTAPDKKPRTIDPGIAAIRAEAKAKVESFRKEQASAALLKRITEDMLPRLTPGDRLTLIKAIEDTAKPQLRKALE